MGFTDFLAKMVHGRNYTEMALDAGFARSVFNERVAAVENAARLTALTASKANVLIDEGDMGQVWGPIVQQRRFLQGMMLDLLRDGNFVAEIVADPPGFRRASNYEILGKRSFAVSA